MTRHEAVVLSAFTGILMCDFQDMHEYIEKVMGYPVLTHEMGNREFMDEVKEATRSDFMEIVQNLTD